MKARSGLIGKTGASARLRINEMYIRVRYGTQISRVLHIVSTRYQHVPKIIYTFGF